MLKRVGKAEFNSLTKAFESFVNTIQDEDIGAELLLLTKNTNMDDLSADKATFLCQYAFARLVHERLKHTASTVEDLQPMSIILSGDVKNNLMFYSFRSIELNFVKIILRYYHYSVHNVRWYIDICMDEVQTPVRPNVYRAVRLLESMIGKGAVTVERWASDLVNKG